MINKNQAFKQERFYISVILTVISVAFFAFAYTLYLNPKQEPSYEEKKKEDIANCTKFAGFKGFKHRMVGRTNVELTDDRLTLDVKTFSDAEAVMLACSNLEPQLFCLGVEEYCGISGKKMVLTYEEPKAY